MGQREISLPVLKILKVTDYQMYPGKTGHGFSHTFAPGPNIIVGINGIGKTTLLELIARTLIGPEDLPIKEQLGTGKRELTRTAYAKSYFSSRVADAAVNATSELTISIGEHIIIIRRSLRDLRLLYYSFDRLEYHESDFHDEKSDIEISLIESICEASGIDSYYDFVFLVKYLMFYLEERRTLAWDSWAQIELLRILFIPTSLQEEYKENYSTAISNDSLARNLRATAHTLENRKIKLIRSLSSFSKTDLNTLKIKAEEYQNKLNNIKAVEDNLNSERHQIRKKLEIARHESSLCAQRLIKAREEALRQFFPTLSDYGKLAISAIESKHGCIVCGCQDEKHLQLAIENFYKHTACPVCGARPEQQENHHHSEEQLNLEEIDHQQSKHIKDINTLEIELDNVNTNYHTAKIKRIEIELAYNEADQEYTKNINAINAASDNNINDIDRTIHTLRKQIDEAWSKKEIAVGALTKIATELTNSVSNFKDDLTSSFNNIIKSFLAEDCTLHYRTTEKKIGQEGQLVKFPEFYINMTSGVFSTLPVLRESTSSVSESQKEFVEISLRMAFINTALPHNQTTMLIETPEANLDAVFMPKAGNAFKCFTEKTQPNHILIASSNLNGTAMIPSILGIVDERGNNIANPQSYNETHILNLLQLAQKNKALKEYGPEYERNLTKALNP